MALDHHHHHDKEQLMIPVFTVWENNRIITTIILRRLPLNLNSEEEAEAEAEAEAEERLLIGAHPRCDIQLEEHPSIGRFHLEVCYKPSTRSLVASDAASIHGTWISGKRVRAEIRVKLNEGDTLYLGTLSRLYKVNWLPLSRACYIDNPFVPHLGISDTINKKTEGTMDQDGNSLSCTSDQVKTLTDNMEGLEMVFSDEDLRLHTQNMILAEPLMLANSYDSFSNKEEAERNLFGISSEQRSSAVIAEDKDIISQLPDDILISIITRISTKEAVRTSIMSKRWRNLYKFVSTIDFRCRYLVGEHTSADCEAIIDPVDRFLRLHSGSSISSFDFRCCLTKSYADNFEQWVYFLGKLGIEKLILQFCCRYWCTDVPFSCHLLSHMPSLKYLELVLCPLLPNFKTPCYSLKTLRLTRVTVLPGSLECILSNCLSLHSLTVDHCKFPSKLCFRGSNLQLHSLMIQDCEGVNEIEFYASNLITFEFHNPEMVKFIFEYVPQLQSIYLSLSDRNLIFYVCERLAKQLPHLKSLTFDTQGEMYQLSSVHTGSYMFKNLKRLELSLCCTPKTNLLSLTPFLHFCPLLQEFHLVTTESEYNGPQAERCVELHSQLKKVEISGFGGTRNEMDFALYILKSAVSLEQMYISRHAKYYIGYGKWMEQGRPPWSSDKCKMIHEQLQGQAISKSARVIFQHASQL